MIRTIVAVGAVVTGAAFAAGFYVGWKTTMKVMDNVIARRQRLA